MAGCITRPQPDCLFKINKTIMAYSKDEDVLHLFISDAGLRGAVTGGAQMDGFIHLFTEIIVDAGIDERYVFRYEKI